jgi:hypothetical protein
MSESVDRVAEDLAYLNRIERDLDRLTSSVAKFFRLVEEDADKAVFYSTALEAINENIVAKMRKRRKKAKPRG